jgi:hypothetical protein
VGCGGGGLGARVARLVDSVVLIIKEPYEEKPFHQLIQTLQEFFEFSIITFATQIFSRCVPFEEAILVCPTWDNQMALKGTNPPNAGNFSFE